MNRLAIGIFIALTVAVLGLGWLYQQQSEQIGALASERDQLAADLQSSEVELQKQHERHLWDQALVARVNQQNRDLHRKSLASQQQTKRDLKDEVCANTALPLSVANRLRDRIHRQAGIDSGSPPG
ncbi:Protein of unknown function [Amphritea atlantica]|uniref:Phage lysis regulatory protein, LysB family n=1 Tax=Amphritea atlantica TaxID=355243 RepID=A0A1H9GFG2_9GAMM|nr:DUF2570 family protein [Amphritea atlantica]SEQ48855.1 Protein of unknown function [Amphritea atlantica]